MSELRAMKEQAVSDERNRGIAEQRQLKQTARELRKEFEALRLKEQAVHEERKSFASEIRELQEQRIL